MSNFSFSVSFILRKERGQNGQAPIFVRISLNKKRAEFSTKIEIRPEHWNSNKSIPSHACPHSMEIIGNLEQIKSGLFKTFFQFRNGEASFTVQDIKSKYLGLEQSSTKKTISDIFDYHLLTQEKILAPGTLKNYHTTLKHIRRFLKKTYRVEDYPLEKVNYKFITELDHYLRTAPPLLKAQPLTNNGLMKNMERFQKVMNMAIRLEWIEKNPFANYQLSFKRVDKGFLTKLELQTIEDKELSIPRMDFIRDLFVFSCYTGLSYIDVIQLAPQHITIGMDGKKWINTARQKTDNRVTIPILPKALYIIHKYQDDPRSINAQTIFPGISNQKLNSYLKELADICGITKKLTFHMARHTFATSVTLANGVPIESVSKMLGHTNLRTTQIYARVVEDKLSKEMQQLENKLNQSKLVGS